MPPEGAFSGSPADWLRHARSDLELARVGRSERILLEGLCFHAQQAAEKALKAALVAMGLRFPKTHSIRALLDLFPPALAPPPEVEQAARLSDYAVWSRYPGSQEPVGEDEYLEALRLAAAVVHWSESIVPA